MEITVGIAVGCNLLNLFVEPYICFTVKLINIV